MKKLTRHSRPWALPLVLAIGVSSASSGAWAQAGAPNTGSVNTVLANANTQPRFYGFSFDLTTADGSGLNSVGHNYRNDFVWYFEPTWNIGQMYLRGSRWRTLQLQARFSLTANASGTDEANFSGHSNASPQGTCGSPTINDNGTVDPGSVGYCNPASNTRRADYSDLWLTLRSPRLYTIPKINVYLNPAFRVLLPTSIESQYQTLAMALTPSIAAGRTFWNDRIRVGYGFGFTKNFHRYTSPQAAPGSGMAATTGGNLSDGAYGAGLSNFYLDPSRDGTIGGYNTSYSISHTISGGVQLNEKWSVDVLYVIIDSFTYDHSCATSNVTTADGVAYDTCSAGDRVAANSGASLARPSHRDSQVFWATLAYQPLDWLGITLAWINWAPLQKLDSSYRQGLISTDYNAFTTIQLGATITVDRLAARYWRK